MQWPRVLSAATPWKGPCFCVSVCQFCPKVLEHLQWSWFSFLPEIELKRCRMCNRMCHRALRGSSCTLRVSLNRCLHGDTCYLYCWLVGLEGIFWGEFYFQIPSPIFTYFSISIKFILTNIPNRRSRTAVQTGTCYINHLNETLVKFGCWKDVR